MSHQPPTPTQWRMLTALARRTGIPMPLPHTQAQARAEILRLKDFTNERQPPAVPAPPLGRGRGSTRQVGPGTHPASTGPRGKPERAGTEGKPTQGESSVPASKRPPG